MADMVRSDSLSASRSDDSRLPQLDGEIVRKAQLVVLGNAEDRNDAELLLNMMGIHPSDWSGNGVV